MKIFFQKTFEKQYNKLNTKMKEKVDKKVQLFREDPQNKILRNHALKGVMKNRRAISVTGDVRIIFREFDSYTLVLMLDVGSHPHVYCK
jgi:addiction module RelE/StbE family toxin